MHRTSKLGLVLALVIVLTTGLVRAVPATPHATEQVFLPLVANNYSEASVFGITMSSLSAERGLDLVHTTNTRWIRRGALFWKLVEPVDGGGYNWDHPLTKELERDMITASANGLRLIVVIYASPRWAVEPYNADCAPINPARYAEFARFLATVVARYSAPPYNVQFWEIGNEPDVAIFPEDNIHGFGCWGIEGDPYYGGQAYGEMLKAVVPAMKAVDPAIKVLNGGLMLDKQYIEGQSTSTSGRFFEGVLRAGAGPYIDIISFHTYVFYRAPGQPPLGPREDWRVNYLRGVTQRYGVAHIPIMRTETGLLCIEVTPECRWAQADFMSRSFVRTMRDGLMGTIWYIYDNDSFHNTAMIEPSDIWVPRPAYFAYRHIAVVLNGAQYAGPIAGIPATVEGYVFTRGAERIYAYWTDDPAGVNFTINVPAHAATRCTKRDGGPLPCTAATGNLTLTAQASPTFITVGP